MNEPTTVEAYLEALPEDRREALSTVRDVVLTNLPAGYVEGISYGMIGYVVPLERYPDTYNGYPLVYAALASQKRYLSLYLMSVYGERETWFRTRYLATGKRLDMGKCCVRFRRLDDLPLELVGEAIAQFTPEAFVEVYERARSQRRRR